MTAIRQLFSLLDAREKRNGLILLGLMLFGAVLEVVGVAAVPAFVAAIVDPERLKSIPGAAGVVDALGLHGSADIVVWGALALLVIFGLKNAFLILNYALQVRYVTNRRVRLAHRLTSAYLSAPYSFHLDRNTAEIMRNVNREANIIAYMVMGGALELCTRLVILLGVLALLFVVEPWITLYWIVFFGLIGGAGVLAFSNRLKRYGELEQGSHSQFMQAVNQGFGGIKEARIANREGYFAEKIQAKVRSIAYLAQYRQVAGKIIAPITEFCAILGLVALAAALVLLGRSTESILVTLSLFVVGLVRLREMLNAALTHLANLRYNLVSVEPVYHDLQTLERGGARRRDIFASPARRRSLKQEIALRDIWQRYEGAKDYSLKGIDVRIPAGSAVGFVGSTGAGKSTLVDTILGLLEPEKGQVLVDGVDIREGGVGGWQRSIGYVPQSIYLLDDTIRRNIAFGLKDEEIDEVALRRAISAAQLDRLIMEQPQGLDTVVGEQGVRLSGGERQRIGIARALYHDPQVIVLDEATSALDNATERAVIAAVDAIRSERTVIMIAHRLTTVRNCDMLYFLKDGRIEASGSFAELESKHSDFQLMAAG